MPLISLYSRNSKIQAELSALLAVLDRDWPEPISTQAFSDFSAFLDSGRSNPRRILMLAQEGATSVELASAAVEECPESPVVWLSDLDFALFSYRLEVAHFGLLPVTKDGLRSALRNCDDQRRQCLSRPLSHAPQVPTKKSLKERLLQWLQCKN